jgi:hypothetical protein
VSDFAQELEFWIWLLVWPLAVLVGFYLLGRLIPIRLAVPIFGVGTGVLAYLAYRLYQSQVEYCKDSFEVTAGGDKFSCLEPQHWFANALAVSFLLLMELGLATLVAGGLVRWLKQRRLKPSPWISSNPPTSS